MLNSKTKTNKEDYEKLTNVANTLEADLIISKLEINEIPSFKSYNSSGSYLNITSGFNYQGTDIYVHKELIDKAKSIISDSEITDEEFYEDNKTFEELKDEYTNKRRNILRVVVFLFIIIPLLFALFTGGFNLMH